MARSSTDKKLSFDRLLKIIAKPDSTVHFIGIGGVSMYSLAVMTVRRGIRVTGSDVATSEHTERLLAAGAKIYKGHSAENISSATLVVYTSAVARDNPELAAAQQQGIPTVTRAEYMGALMINYKSRIGVSGSHGKSTTVAMLDAIFTQAMCEPTVLSGADLPTVSRIGWEAITCFSMRRANIRTPFIAFHLPLLWRLILSLTIPIILTV